MADDGVWRLRVLDHFQLHGPQGPAPLASRKAIALVTYLALQRDYTARRDVVANLLWEDVDTIQARVNLRQVVATLRKLETPEAPFLVADVDTLRLTPSLSTDTGLFERLASGGTAARADAADLYKMDLLAGFSLRDAPAFNEWLSVAQAHWRQRVVGVLLGVAETALDEGQDLNAGAVAGLRLLAIDPFNEAAHRAVMRLYMRQGRSALAVSQYRSLFDLLRKDLDIAPEAETQQLYDTLRHGRRQRDLSPQAGTATPAEAAPVEVEPERPPRIAVVDDEANLRDAVASYMRLHGYEAVECAGGAELDAAIAEGGVDLILLDVTMPGEDGFAIARRLRRTIPTIMLTARTDLIDRVVGLELGADDYVAKPYELREVLARVRAVLRRSPVAA